MSGQRGWRSKEELRGCFLFESLTDEQLDWLVQHGTVETHDPGANVYSQGAPAEYFYVLLDGEIQLVKRLDGTDVVLVTANQPGCLRRGHPGLHQLRRGPVLRSEPADRHALPSVQAAGRRLRLPVEDLVPDGRAPAGRAVPRHDQRRSPARASGTS